MSVPHSGHRASRSERDSSARGSRPRNARLVHAARFQLALLAARTAICNLGLQGVIAKKLRSRTNSLAGSAGREIESLALGLVAVVVGSATTLPHSACAVAGARVPPVLSSRTEDELAHPLRQGALLTRRARSFAV
jgi:hypothetical protein